MPVYEFRCKDEECRKISEFECKFNVRPEEIDCSCGNKAKYVISGKIGTHFPQGRTKGGYFRPDIGGRRYQKFY